MGHFQTFPAPQMARKGAALLALLTPQLGGLPLALAEAQRGSRAPGELEGGPWGALQRTLLVRGGTVELASLPGAGALSLALRLMARAALVEPGRWLCVAMPSASLCASAVAARGVPLHRFLVVHPPASDLMRFSVRVVKSGVFSSVLVDATHLDDLGSLPVATRRLSLGAEEAGTTVFLLTSARAARPQPLPVAVKALVEPSHEGGGLARVLRHRHGHLGTLEIPALDDALVGRFSDVPDAPASPRAGKDLRVPPPTQARGHRERRKAREATGQPSLALVEGGVEGGVEDGGGRGGGRGAG